MKHVVAEMTVRMDPAAARDVAFAEVAAAGFKVRRHGDWDASAKRGSKALKNAIGATGLAAYAEMDVHVRPGREGDAIVELLQDRKGYAKRGGAVRGARSVGYFEDAKLRVAHRFRSDGVLVSLTESE